jgi:cell division protease FtsH
MSITTIDPQQRKPVIERRKFAWEDEETLVDRRKKLRYRIPRFFGNNWGKLLIFGLVMVALLDADVMEGIVGFVGVAVPFLFRFIFIASLILGQFGLMFWFLGRSRMYTIWPGQEGVGFADYRGQPELLEQAKQIVMLLRGVRVFEEAGEPLNGLLLEGPPGTGKTWLAQAISTEAGVPFFFVDASSMNSMFVGIAPLKVGNVYRKARKAAKEYGAAVIFIDEIDAIGSARGGVTTTNRDQDPTLLNRLKNRLPIMFGGMGAGMGLISTLLVEMSGFSQEHGWWARKRNWWYRVMLKRKPPAPQKRVLTVGATNRIQVLDPALLRPGRFDKKIRVDAPDLEGRRDIIEYYLSKMAHDETMDPVIIAAETPNYTPADIKYLLNEALRYALFDGRTYMTYRDFKLAQPEHEMGLRSPIKNMTREDKFRLAAHEAGHAVAVRLFMPKYRISRVTIIRQGAAHGHVSYQPAVEEFDYMSTYEQLMNRLRVAVAGKAGEMEFVGEHAQTLGVGVTAGGSSDFGQIRTVLWMMANAGMFGPLGANFNGTNYSPEMREAMEETFRMVLEEVRLAFRVHKDMALALIHLLMEKEELLSEEVEAFFDQYGLFTPRIVITPSPRQQPEPPQIEAPEAVQ